MRKILLIVLCLRFSLMLAFGQEAPAPPVNDNPTVESVDLTGVPESRISGQLRDLMKGLVGRKFDQVAADEVAFQIQNQLSEHISAIRELEGTEPDRIKVVFVIGDDRDDEHRANVNSRYTVEAVEIQGFPESSISDALLADIHKLAGDKLDQDRAEALEKRLGRELGDTRTVSRRVVKGADHDHVRLIYDVGKAPILKFDKDTSYIVAQSKQSISFRTQLDIDCFGSCSRSTNFYIGAANDANPLLERDAGYFIGVQNIKAGTDHLGFRLEYFDFRAQWNSTTRLALKTTPQSPGIYRERRGFRPGVTFAFDRHLDVTAGITVQELQMQDPAIHFQNVNVGFGAVNFHDSWKDSSNANHRVSAEYSVRAGSRTLDSDFSFTRQLGTARYEYASRHQEFIASAQVGVLTGNAPLFERFSLGSATTLRGWNKYDLSPLGGSRMGYGSLEYRFSVLQVYYDAGTVWDRDGSRKISHAVGFGLHGRKTNDWFATLGVPVRSGRIQPLKPVFMVGGYF